MNKIQNFAQSCLKRFAVADVIGQFKKFVGAGIVRAPKWRLNV